MSTVGTDRPCGTLQYLPPESLDGKRSSYKQDVYGFSMILFEVLVPSQDSPWEEDADSSEAIRQLVKTGQRPSIPVHLSSECPAWYVPLMKNCWQNDPNLRPDLPYIAKVTTHEESLDCTQNVVTICLKLHQGTAMEKIGDFAAERVCKGLEVNQYEIDKQLMNSDGTNGCSFFAIMILDYIYTTDMTDSFIYEGGLAKKVEDIIKDSPKIVNSIRDKQLKYSPDTALDMLTASNVIKTKYTKLELVLDHNSNALQEGVSKLIDTNDECKVNCAAFVAPPYTLSVAGVKTVDGNRVGVLIDTHRISPDLGGDNNAIIKCFRITESVDVAAKQIVGWIARRTESSSESYSIIQIKQEDHDHTSRAENNTDHALDGLWDENWDEEIWCESWDELEVVEPLAQSTQKMEKEVEPTVESTQKMEEEVEPTVEISNENERLFKGYATELGILNLKTFQTKAIQSFKEKRDCLIVQATSSGKSICFQVPSLMLDKGKFVLVVSPTISLMESQVHALSLHGIPAVYFSATCSHNLEEMKALTSESKPRIIYMTPEYLMGNSNSTKEGALKALIRMDDDIGLIVIDECHKVFDRSGDFRYVTNQIFDRKN